MKTGNQLMKQLAEVLIRYRWIVLALTLVSTVFFGYHISKLKLNADFATYLEKGSDLVTSYDHVGEEFGGKSTSFLIVRTERGIDSRVMQLLDRLTQKIKASDDVSFVTSLTNVVDFKSTEYGLEVDKLLPKNASLTEGQTAKLLKYALTKKRYRDVLLSNDQKSANLIIRLKPGTDEYAFSNWLSQMSNQTIAETTNLNQSVKAYAGGMPSLMYSMTTLITENLTTLLPIMIVLMVLILFLGFRRPGGVLIPFFDVTVSTIWAMGVVQLLGYDLNLLVGIMPVILLAMGSADGIHLMKGYYEHRYDGLFPKQAVIGTMGELGVPILITSLTTSIGFLSLVISNFDVIKQFGVATALAILVAFAVTLIIVPVVLSFAPEKTMVSPRDKKRVSTGFFDGLSQFVLGHPGKILTGSFVLLIGSALLIPRIQKDVDWSLCLAKGSDPYKAEMILRSEYGGSLPAQILYQGDLQDPEVLRQIFLTENYLESLGKIDQPLSIAGVIAEMNYVMTGKYMIPATREGVSNLWFLLQGEDLLPQLVSNNKHDALLQGKIASMDTRILVDAVDKVNAFLDQSPDRFHSPEVQAVALILSNAREFGASIDTARVRSIIENYQSNSGALQERIKQDVTDYLLSDNSVVPVENRSKASLIAEAVSTLDASEPENITAKRLEQTLQRPVFHLSKDDIYFLSKSLATILNDTRGALRNEYLWKKLTPMIPDSVAQNPDFRKEVTGAFWLLNQESNTDTVNEPPVTLAATHTGLPPILKQMEEELTPTQVESVLLALVLIVILFSIIFRSVKIGLLGIIPLVLTIILNFGVMALLHIGLDSFTAMIASLTIGLGVDYAVHFTSRFERELEKSGSMTEVIRTTMKTTGKAIMINAFAVGVGFAVLLLAGGQHIRRFGGLTSFTMITAATLTLTVLPAVFLVFRRKEKVLKGLEE